MQNNYYYSPNALQMEIFSKIPTRGSTIIPLPKSEIICVNVVVMVVPLFSTLNPKGGNLKSGSPFGTAPITLKGGSPRNCDVKSRNPSLTNQNPPC